MKAFTMISTPEWRALSDLTIPQAERMLGVEIERVQLPDLEEGRHSWERLKMFDFFPDAATCMVIDADIVFLKPWKPELPDGYDIAAVEELNPWTIQEAWKFGLPTYYNAGLFIARNTEEVRKAFDVAYHYPPKNGQWYEQTSWNFYVQGRNIPVYKLPKAVNQLHDHRNPNWRADAANAIGYHLAGFGVMTDKRLALARQLLA